MPLIRAELLRKHQLGSPVLVHDPSLVGFWPFDYDDGSYARDRSGHVNRGTIYGASKAGGKIGGALNFDGIDDYVKVFDSPSLRLGPGSFSLLMWVNVYDTGRSNERLIYTFNPSTSRGFMLYHHYGTFKFETWNPSAVVTSIGFSAGIWVHVAFVRDILATNKFKIYVNGGNLQEAAGHSETVTTEDPYYFSIDRTLANPFKGYMDDVRVYNRALSQAEIIRVMNLRGI